MDMTGPLIGLGIGAVTGAAGLFGAASANKEIADAEKKRPIYSRPEEINQYLELAKTGYNSKMPGTSQFEQNAQQATQGAISNLEDTGRFDAGAIQKLYQSELGAYNNLAMQQAQYHQSQQEQLSRALSESAKYSDQEFEYNINAPWMRKYQNSLNKLQSSRNMIQSGAGIMANSAAWFGSNPQKPVNPFGVQSAGDITDNPSYYGRVPQFGFNESMMG